MESNMMETAMLSHERMSNPVPMSASAADYDVVRRAIAHIKGNWRAQPEIEQIAEAAGVTPTELHHLFRRWAGLTPKAFLQALTLDSARNLLRDSASVLDASYEVGLSGPGRPHDLFGTHFEVRVWETLLRIPMGRATTYSDIAGNIGRPKAARAVGTAVGKNPISFVVPCHRVIGKSGELTGYHWGLTRKRAMLGWEAGTVAA